MNERKRDAGRNDRGRSWKRRRQMMMMMTTLLFSAGVSFRKRKKFVFSTRCRGHSRGIRSFKSPGALSMSKLCVYSIATRDYRIN